MYTYNPYIFYKDANDFYSLELSDSPKKTNSDHESIKNKLERLFGFEKKLNTSELLQSYGIPSEIFVKEEEIISLEIEGKTIITLAVFLSEMNHIDGFVWKKITKKNEEACHLLTVENLGFYINPAKILDNDDKYLLVFNDKKDRPTEASLNDFIIALAEVGAIHE